MEAKDKPSVVADKVMFDIETKTFNEKLPELLVSDNGKYVVIKGSNIEGIFTSQDDALKCGYSKFKKEPFFMQQILPFQIIQDFANNHFIV
jgi:hypothetical protein